MMKNPVFQCIVKIPSQLFLIFFVFIYTFFNPLSANFKKWSNTLKQFVGKLPRNCFSVFDHFVGLTLKGLRST